MWPAPVFDIHTVADLHAAEWSKLKKRLHLWGLNGLWYLMLTHSNTAVMEGWKKNLSSEPK